MPAINGASVWRNKLGKKLFKMKKNQSQFKNFFFFELYVTTYNTLKIHSIFHFLKTQFHLKIKVQLGARQYFLWNNFHALWQLNCNPGLSIC